jgi:hypothetical protein
MKKKKVKSYEYKNELGKLVFTKKKNPNRILNRNQARIIRIHK